MGKDRKSKARALGATIGVSAAVTTAVIIALALTLSAGSLTRASSVIYPSDLPPNHDQPIEPPAP